MVIACLNRVLCCRRQAAPAPLTMIDQKLKDIETLNTRVREHSKKINELRTALNPRSERYYDKEEGTVTWALRKITCTREERDQSDADKRVIKSWDSSQNCFANLHEENEQLNTDVETLLDSLDGFIAMRQAELVQGQNAMAAPVPALPTAAHRQLLAFNKKVNALQRTNLGMTGVNDALARTQDKFGELISRNPGKGLTFDPFAIPKSIVERTVRTLGGAAVTLTAKTADFAWNHKVLTTAALCGGVAGLSFAAQSGALSTAITAATTATAEALPALGTAVGTAAETYLTPTVGYVAAGTATALTVGKPVGKFVYNHPKLSVGIATTAVIGGLVATQGFPGATKALVDTLTNNASDTILDIAQSTRETLGGYRNSLGRSLTDIGTQLHDGTVAAGAMKDQVVGTASNLWSGTKGYIPYALGTAVVGGTLYKGRSLIAKGAMGTLNLVGQGLKAGKDGVVNTANYAVNEVRTKGVAGALKDNAVAATLGTAAVAGTVGTLGGVGVVAAAAGALYTGIVSTALKLKA